MGEGKRKTRSAMKSCGIPGEHSTIHVWSETTVFLYIFGNQTVKIGPKTFA